MRYALPLIFILASLGGQQTINPPVTEEEQQLIDLTNAARKKNKLPPVTINATLTKVARAHSANMAKQGKMAHELDGKSPFDRLKDAGYKFSTAAENIAVGDVTVETVMNAWMASKVHRTNILDGDFTEIGIGLVKDDKNEFYFTQVFATPQK